MKTIDAYREAINEAKRFIDRAEKAINVIGKEDFFWSSPETASAKRASMDLSKALVKIRKPFLR